MHSLDVRCAEERGVRAAWGRAGGAGRPPVLSHSRHVSDSASDTMSCRGIAERLGQPGAELELVAVLQGSDLNSSISTFEFLTSGVVTRLRAYLQGPLHARLRLPGLAFVW